MSEQPVHICQGARAVLGILIECYDKGYRLPSQSTLSAILGVEKRTVARYMRQLRELGLVATHERKQGADLMIQPSDLPTHLMIDLPTHLMIMPVRSDDRSADSSDDRSDDHAKNRHVTIKPQKARSDDQSDDRRARGGGFPTLFLDSPTPKTKRAYPVSDKGRWMVQKGMNPTVAAELEKTLEGVSIAQLEREFTELKNMGKGVGAIVLHWRASPPQPSMPIEPQPEQHALPLLDVQALDQEIDRLLAENTPASRHKALLIKREIEAYQSQSIGD